MEAGKGVDVSFREAVCQRRQAICFREAVCQRRQAIRQVRKLFNNVASDTAERRHKTAQSTLVSSLQTEAVKVVTLALQLPLPFPTNSLSPVEIDWAAEAVDSDTIALVSKSTSK